MSTENQKAKWRKASVDYRKTHPDTVALCNRRTCLVRKAILKWMRIDSKRVTSDFRRSFYGPAAHP
jgi:hypothetical protein